MTFFPNTFSRIKGGIFRSSWTADFKTDKLDTARLIIFSTYRVEILKFISFKELTTVAFYNRFPYNGKPCYNGFLVQTKILIDERTPFAITEVLNTTLILIT